MNITEIRTIDAKPFIPRELRPEEKKSVISKNIDDKIEISNNNISWQNDILLSALEMLENNKQMDNNHPLDRIGNQPIENFDEALEELKFLQSDKFKLNASGAQANINAIDILSLFVSEN